MKKLLTLVLLLALSGHAYAQSIMLLGAGPEGGVAFPTFQTSAVTSCAATPCTVNLPASIAAGDLLLTCAYIADGRSFTLPTGWTSTISSNSTVGSGAIGCAYKLPATGSEGATMSQAIGSASTWAQIVWRISGASGITAGTLNTASIDPPSFTPVAGAKNYLWVIFAGGRETGPPVMTAPANYTGLVQQTNTGGNTSTIGMAYRQLNATTEDAATFTNTGTITNPGSNVFAVAP